MQIEAAAKVSRKRGRQIDDLLFYFIECAISDMMSQLVEVTVDFVFIRKDWKDAHHASFWLNAG